MAPGGRTEKSRTDGHRLNYISRPLVGITNLRTHRNSNTIIPEKKKPTYQNHGRPGSTQDAP